MSAAIDQPQLRRRPAVPEPIKATDSLGRSLTIRKLDALRELDLVEAAGQNSDNRRWMMLATLAASVTHVDGIPAPELSERRYIRDWVQEVGSEGIAAVVQILAPEEAKKVKDDTTTAAAAKKSPGIS